MKSNEKSKIIILIAVGILIALSPMITVNFSLIAENSIKSLEYSNDINLDNKNLKISAVSGKIHIDNNWTAAKAAGICTGEGTYSDPYIIEDLVIDGEGSGSCILIENSDVYFKIENCTLFNSGIDGWYNAGIRLVYVNKSRLIDNNCSSNYYGIKIAYSINNTVLGNIANDNSYGILIWYSNNNTVSGNNANSNYRGIRLDSSDYNNISGNTVNKNTYGIRLYSSDYNNVSKNIANYNNNFGIWIEYSNNNTISGNIMNECGLLLSGNLEMLTSLIIDTTNLVNGKPLYYYLNEINLGPNNFTNAGQVILVSCSDSLISNLYTSICDIGISLHYCNNNNISGNTANGNYYGIRINDSNNNTVSGNTVNDNLDGIFLRDSNNNTVSGNTVYNNFKHGIRLYRSDYNNVSGNTANNNSYGIYLSNSNINIISGNTANNNKDTGIYLYHSNYNTISGNILVGNAKCILEVDCEGNEFSDNGACTYGQEDGIIPGYNLFILLGTLSVAVILTRKKIKKS